MALDFKRRDEIRAELSGRTLEIFDDMWSKAFEPNPEIILQAARLRSMAERAVAANKAAMDNVKIKAARRNKAYHEYMMAHPHATDEDVFKIAMVIYASDIPESMISKDIKEIRVIYERNMRKAGAPA